MADIDIENTKVAPGTPDLEKARDEKCIPVAREILTEMVNTLLPEDANVMVDYNPILKTIMKKTIDTDMNIASETTYLFQLLLGVFAGLNTSVQTCKTIPIDDVRYASIGKRILKVVAEGNVTMGSVTPDQTTADFAPIKDKLNDIFAAEQLSMLELKYIMDSIFSSFKTVEQLYTKNIEQSSERAEAKLFGLEAMSDLTVGRLNEVLTTDISKPKPEEAKAE